MKTAKFTVEKDVPIPAQHNGRPPGSNRYPFHNMEIGESFLIGVDELMTKRVRQYATYMKSHHNLHFTIRKTEEGYRCWRIS